MKRFYLFFGLALIASTALSSSAFAEKRVALVIGNSAYQNTITLPNPRNDAMAISEALKRLGFETSVWTDLDKAGMDRAIRGFGNALEGASVGLFYYAGHGLQVAGQNYLVPVDAKLSKERDLTFEAIDVGVVLQQLESAPRTNLVFLDACRDNPLANNLAGSLGGKRSMVGRGLTRIDANAGTMISYATKEGTTAEDGQGRNSPYATALLKHIETPGLEVAMMLRRVREDVLTSTNREQVPWEYGSLLGEFYLKPAPPAPVQAALVSSPASSVSPPSAPASVASAAPAGVQPGDGLGAAELEFWNAIKSSANFADYQAYLDTYPNGHFVALARVRMKGTQVAIIDAPLPPNERSQLISPSEASRSVPRPALTQPNFDRIVIDETEVPVYSMPDQRSDPIGKVQSVELPVLGAATGEDGRAWLQVEFNGNRGSYVDRTSVTPWPEWQLRHMVSGPVEQVIDASKLVVGHVQVTLYGIRAEPGPWANGFVNYVKAKKLEVRCHPRTLGTYVCLNSQDLDVAQTILLNGAARVERGGPKEYLDIENKARALGKGMWK